MPTIQQGELLRDASVLLELRAEGCPDHLKDDVQLTFPLQKFYADISRGMTSTVTSTGQTIYTIPADKDFFLTFAQLSYTKDAACDCVAVQLNGTSFDGLAVNILSLLMNPLILNNDNLTGSYTYPIKLKAGTNITLIGSFTVGTMTKRGVIQGFLI